MRKDYYERSFRRKWFRSAIETVYRRRTWQTLEGSARAVTFSEKERKRDGVRQNSFFLPTAKKREKENALGEAGGG